MAIINVNLNIAFNEALYYITNNFITTLFIVALVIFIIDKGKKKYYIYFAVWQVLTTIITIVFVNFLEIPKIYDIAGAMFYAALFGNVFLTEGGILFIILGVILYLTRNNKISLIILYSGFTTFIYLLVRRYGYHLGLIELRSEEHTSELQSRGHLVCRLLLEKKKIDYSFICIVTNDQSLLTHR